jgi:general secretion pathway protein A
MYESFYGLKEKPFQIVSDPQYLFLSPAHENALTYLEYGLIENVAFILLTGEVGAGKTTLVNHIVNQFSSKKEIGMVFNTNVSTDDLICLIMKSFQVQPKNGNKVQNLETFNNYLFDRYMNRQKLLLIIDEAQNLSDDALEEIRLFSNLQVDNQNLLQIMLVGQPELKEKLMQPRHVPFAQRIAVNFYLTGLSKDETRDYILFRLKMAGRETSLFDTEAIDQIYHSTGGIPRAINLMCDTALVYGFGYELNTITTEVIQQVLKDKDGIGLQDKEKPVAANRMTHFEFVENDLESIEKKQDGLFDMILAMQKRLDLLEEKSGNETRKELHNERVRYDRILLDHSKLKAKYDILLSVLRKKTKEENP